MTTPPEPQDSEIAAANAAAAIDDAAVHAANVVQVAAADAAQVVNAAAADATDAATKAVDAAADAAARVVKAAADAATKAANTVHRNGKSSLPIGSFVMLAFQGVFLAVLGTFGYFFSSKFDEILLLRNEVTSLKVAMSKVEGNRFTSTDGLAVWKAQAETEKVVAALAAKLQQGVPPIWFEDQVKEIGVTVKDTQQAVNDNSRAIDRLVVQVEQLNRESRNE